MTSEPLAEVKVSKLKDCPMLTAGKITPQVLQNWGGRMLQVHEALRYIRIKWLGFIALPLSNRVSRAIGKSPGIITR